MGCRSENPSTDTDKSDKWNVLTDFIDYKNKLHPRKNRKQNWWGKTKPDLMQKICKTAKTQTKTNNYPQHRNTRKTQTGKLD